MAELPCHEMSAVDIPEGSRRAHPSDEGSTNASVFFGCKATPANRASAIMHVATVNVPTVRLAGTSNESRSLLDAMQPSTIVGPRKGLDICLISLGSQSSPCLGTCLKGSKSEAPSDPLLSDCPRYTSLLASRNKR